MNDTTDTSRIDIENDVQFVAGFGDGRRPSEAVIEAVAAVEDVTPPNLDPRLYDTLDPDALDALLTGDSRPDLVAFSYCGHEVVLERDGRVAVA